MVQVHNGRIIVLGSGDSVERAEGRVDGTKRDEPTHHISWQEVDLLALLHHLVEREEGHVISSWECRDVISVQFHSGCAEADLV